MGRQVFTAGEILTAASMNDLGDQTVMVFDDATARATAIPTPVEGMVTYLKDTDRLEQFDGTDFVVAAPPQTGVLQVVSTAKTDVFVMSSPDFTPVTGLNVSITPSSTASKVLVIAQVAHGFANATHWGHFKITGGNSSGYVGDGPVGNRVAAVFGGGVDVNETGKLVSASIVFLDSPATTSATTYQVEVRIGSQGSVHVNRAASDADIVSRTRGASSITVMEVAG